MKTFPLLQSQFGIFMECLKEPESTQYCLPFEVQFKKDVNADRLEKAVLQVFSVRREMHICFLMEDDEPRQYFNEEMQIKVERLRMEEEGYRDYQKQFIKPFDLLNGEPFWKFSIVETSENTYLLWNVSHLIFDGYSFGLFASDLSLAYDNKALAPNSFSLFECADEEQASFDTDDYKRAAAYYKEKFCETEFVTLSKVSSADSTLGKLIRKSICLPMAEVDKWCESQSVPVHQLFMAAFSIVLSRFSRQEKVGFYTVYHGRMNQNIRDLYGMFVKSIPMQSDVNGSLPVKELINSLHFSRTLACYPFSHFVRDLQSEPRVCFGFQGPANIYKLNLDGRDNPVLQPLRPNATDDLSCVIYSDNRNYEIRMESSDALNSADTLETFGNAVRDCVLDILTHPDALISELNIVNESGQQSLIAMGRGEDLSYDAAGTIVDIFRKQVALRPASTAVADIESSYTYSELDKASDALASELIRHGVEKDDFVCIMLPRCKEFLVSALAVFKSGGAYVPLDADYPNDRLLYMLEDSRAKVLVTTSAMLAEKREDGDFDAQNIILTDSFDFGRKSEPVNRSAPASLAYMIYTSGSTGKPKGVMIEHRGFVNFLKWETRLTELTEKDRCTVHPSFSFDASMFDLYPPLTVGGEVHILPSSMRQDLESMYQYFRDHKISGMLVSTQIGMELLNQYDLPVRYLLVGGEKLNPTRPTSVKLVNCYGPTEFTICSSYHYVDQHKEYKNIPIGKSVPNTISVIVDGSGRLLPQGVEGELCLIGCQMARGYWNRPELTEEKFAPCPFMEGEKMYHTGDLVRWNAEGEMEYLGRIDNLVKLRGFRIELGEIESVISKYEGITAAVVEVKEINGVQQLCAYYTANTEIDKEKLRSHLTESLTEYMVPAVYMQLETMPLTPNGKVNRKLLPLPELTAEEVVSPETEQEQALFDLVSSQLKTTSFGVTTSLMAIGLTSIGAMKLSVAIQKKLGLELKTKDILQHPTIRAWVNLATSEKESVKSYPKQEYYPLTENQIGVYIDWEQHRDSLQYNVPIVIKLAGADPGKLKESVEKAVCAHPYLKVRFQMTNGGLVQVRRDDAPMEITVTRCDQEPDQSFFQSLVHPFDLTSEALCRIGIYTTGKAVYLFMDIHHTIFDGGSANILLHDIMKAYNGDVISGESFSAYDYALYYNEWMNSPGYDKSELYFSKLLEGVESVRYPLSARSNGAEKSYSLSLSLERSGVSSLSRQLGVTENSVFMTVITQALHRITRENNLSVTTVSNGRGLSAMSDTLGMFVQTLPLVSHNVKSSIADAVRHMQLQLIDTIGHDKYPFTKIVERFGIRPDIMVAYQGDVLDGNVCFGEIPMESISVELDTVKAPMTINILPSKDAVELLFEYDGSKYSEVDVRHFADTLKSFTERIVSAKPDSEITAIPMLSETCQQSLIAIGRGENLAYDTTDTVVDLFRKQVALRPASTAVADIESSYTYSELDKASDALASELIRHGVEKDDFVCIMLPRCKEFLVSALAVFKAGGAYVPLDADYPNDRLLYMLEDSRAKVLVTTSTMLAEKREDGDFDAQNIILTDSFDFGRKSEPVNRSAPASLAYMIYTSGSTGKPKGVMIEHRGFVNFLKWETRLTELTEKDRCTVHPSFSFDASMFDLYPPLTVGGEVHILPSSMRQDLESMYQYFRDHKISGMLVSTQIGMELLNQYDLPIRYLLVGGEKLNPTRPTSVKLVNCYGPTEFTICSSYHSVDQTKETVNIPIGKSVPNSISAIVDGSGNLLPQGVAGELCLIGRQMARGYWNRPELTGEKFAPCPFIEGAKMYHTGDLVRWNEEGEMEYMGRIDNQVKLRGFRIELGEIESVISKYEGITAAVVEVKEINGVQHLCAYYTAGTEIDKEKLQAHLAESLTEYMVPTAYMQLETMPLTPNGKVNRKVLPLITIESNITYEAPTNDVEKCICDVFADILSLEKVGINHDFFQIGGTSILAIKAIVKLYNAGYKIVYGEMFKLKTPAAIAKFLLDRNSDSEKKSDEFIGFSDYDYSKIDAILQKKHDLWNDFSLTPQNRVLVVGATGFLGIHVLHHLLMHSDCEIICLVRAKSHLSPRNRLKSLLVYYLWDNWEEQFDKRVKVTDGDLTDENLAEKLENEQIDTIFNCAAIVKHYVANSKEMEAINVTGVSKLVSLCEKNGATLIHVSTVSIGGYLENEKMVILNEHSFHIGQMTNNEYIRTKFLAERIVLQAVADGKIHAKIMRVGNLMGREYDGEFQINSRSNAFANSLKAMKVMGCITLDDMMSAVELSPIDRVAEAICLLAQTPSDMVLFHPYNNYTINQAIIVKSFNDFGYKVEVTSRPFWSERWNQLMRDSKKADCLQGLLHYQQDIGTIAMVPPENDYTTRLLYRLGFYWNPPHEGYVIKLISMLDGLGFFDE